MADCELAVYVVPRAAKAGVAGRRGEAVLVRLAAAPVDGAANAELLTTLARALDLPRRALSLTRGATSRHKRVHIDGLGCDEVRQRLGLLDGSREGDHP